MTNFLLILIACALVLLNSFFVAAEFGMVKLRHTRVAVIKKSYGWRGKILAQVHQHLDAYLSACQLGITLASLGLGWVGEPAFADLLQPAFQMLGVDNPEAAKFIAFVVAFSLISFLHIVVGELMPKSLAIRQSERVSVWTAVPLYIFYWVMFPAIWLLNITASLLLKVFGLDMIAKGERSYSTEEIKLILGVSHLHGELTRDETEILKHTLDFADLTVADVMQSASKMVTLNINDSIDHILKEVIKHRYTRYPVVNNKSHKVLGILHVKDLFAEYYKNIEIKNIKSLLRPAINVLTDMPAIKLLQKFRHGKSHFAIVESNKEKWIGFVTLDDLLHMLVGRIRDEFHRTHDEWVTNANGSILMQGKATISALERALDIKIKVSSEDVNTIGGLILDKTGTVPRTKEKIDFPHFVIKIEKMDGPQIQLVRIIPKKKSNITS